LHDSEAAALDYFPVDAGTGASSKFRHSAASFLKVALWLLFGGGVPSCDVYGRCAGVLSGLGTGTNTSTFNITGFGSSDVVLGVKPSPGGSLIDAVYQAHCGYRNRNASQADIQWNTGCQSTSGSQPLCGLDAVLIRAWCTRQFQSLGTV
jgi:hypothetical protein